MENAEGHISIARKKEGEDKYTQLQKKALEKIQRLAGNVWTDYNLHDPGVTLLDVLNYGLLETDYRLGFSLADYLVRKDGSFFPPAHALYSPSEVFPVNPVTETDYRKLFLSNIEDLSDVRVIVHRESGTYDFVLDVWSGTGEARRKQIVKEVYSLYHSHRNLCENVGMVRFLQYETLYLSVQVEVGDTVDANQTTARVLFEVQEFLRAGIRFRRVDELLAEGKTVDEILDGPEQGRMVVDDDSLCTDWEEYDIAWLYQRLRTLPGIDRILSLSFMNEKNEECGNLRRKGILHGYALASPDDEGHRLQLTRRGRPVSILWNEVQRQFYGMRTVLYGVQNRTTDKEILDKMPQGAYRDVFSHYPLQYDLPGYYQKNMDKPAEEYLHIFDDAIVELLTELQSLPYWMIPDNVELTDKKEMWMDVLDRLYGEDSNPLFLHRYENSQQRRRRRMAFLKNIPSWGLNRGKGMNLTGNFLKEEAGIETYFKSLVDAGRYGMELYVVEHRFLSYTHGEFVLINEDVFRITVVLAVDETWICDDDFRHGCEKVLSERIPAHIRLAVKWQHHGQTDAFRATYQFWKYSLCSRRKHGLEELSDKLKKELDDDNNWYGKI